MAPYLSPRSARFLHMLLRQANFTWSKVLSIRTMYATSCRHKDFHTPSPEEMARLSERFPNPVKTVCTFLEPITKVKPEHHFTIDVRSSRYLRPNQRWKVSLRFTWPEVFSVTAVKSDRQDAVRGAFLEACRTLTHLGLLKPKGGEVSFVEHLMFSKRKAETRLPCEVLRINSKCELLEDGSQRWHSEVTLWWPTYIQCQDVGLSQHEALRNATVHAFIKLKTGGFLNKENNIREVLRISLPRKERDGPFVPDYEVYVDSTSHAYGAYLLCHEVEGKDDMIPWINAQWPEVLKPHFMTPRSNSTMFEFCAVLSTIYTWKKKLVGKRVLVYNDNLHTVDMINHGVPLQVRGKKPIYCKVFAVLRDTCAKYDIELRGQHIVRHLNRPADCLSKFKVSDFKKMVPNAKTISKKSKQILFCLPLVERNAKEENHEYTHRKEREPTDSNDKKIS